MTIARDTGCSDFVSTDAASRSTSSSLPPTAAYTPVTPNTPLVSVPVLSNKTILILRAASKAKRCRTKKPLRAAIVVEIEATKGIARPNACGQAITSTATIRVKPKSAPRSGHQTNNVSSPVTIAIIVR